jgi:hypothetical protein
MRLSRRAFALGLTAAAFALGAGASSQVTERRVYDQGSVLPPRELLVRNRIRPASIRHTPQGAEYLIPFDSLEARAKAWDRFNTDPEWCSLRDRGNVRLRELVVI